MSHSPGVVEGETSLFENSSTNTSKTGEREEATERPLQFWRGTGNPFLQGGNPCSSGGIEKRRPKRAKKGDCRCKRCGLQCNFLSCNPRAPPPPCGSCLRRRKRSVGGCGHIPEPRTPGQSACACTCEVAMVVAMDVEQFFPYRHSHSGSKSKTTSNISTKKVLLFLLVLRIGK